MIPNLQGHATQRLGVTATTVRRWEAAGRISAKRTVGGQRRYEEDEVQRLATEPCRPGKRRPPEASEPEWEDISGSSQEAGAGEVVEPKRAAYPIPPWEQRTEEARADLEVHKLQQEKEDLIRQREEELAAAERARLTERRSEEHLSRERENRERRRKEEERRIDGLLLYAKVTVGVSGAPSGLQAEITRDLLDYVTPVNFPDALSPYEAQSLIKQRIEQGLSRWQKKQKRKEHYESLRREARNQAHLKTLGGDWDSEAAREACKEVERLFEKQVSPEWHREEVVDWVDLILDALGVVHRLRQPLGIALRFCSGARYVTANAEPRRGCAQCKRPHVRTSRRTSRRTCSWTRTPAPLRSPGLT